MSGFLDNSDNLLEVVLGVRHHGNIDKNSNRSFFLSGTRDKAVTFAGYFHKFNSSNKRKILA